MLSLTNHSVAHSTAPLRAWAAAQVGEEEKSCRRVWKLKGGGNRELAISMRVKYKQLKRERQKRQRVNKIERFSKHTGWATIPSQALIEGKLITDVAVWQKDMEDNQSAYAKRQVSVWPRGDKL